MTVKEMIDRYAAMESLTFIGRRAGKDRCQIARLLRSAGVTIRPRGGARGTKLFTENERRLIVHYYYVKKIGCDAIGKRLGRSNGVGVRSVLKRLGFPLRNVQQAVIARDGRRNGRWE